LQPTRFAIKNVRAEIQRQIEVSIAHDHVQVGDRCDHLGSVAVGLEKSKGEVKISIGGGSIGLQITLVGERRGPLCAATRGATESDKKYQRQNNAIEGPVHVGNSHSLYDWRMIFLEFRVKVK
jgi:hypothetical protein